MRAFRASIALAGLAMVLLSWIVLSADTQSETASGGKASPHTNQATIEPMAMSQPNIVDSNFIWIQPTETVIRNTHADTEFKTAVMVSNRIPLGEIVLNLDYGDQKILRVNTDTSGPLGNAGVTWGPMGRDTVWIYRMVNIDNSRNVVSISLLTSPFLSALPPTSDTLCYIHWRLKATPIRWIFDLDTSRYYSGGVVMADSTLQRFTPNWFAGRVNVGPTNPEAIRMITLDSISGTWYSNYLLTDVPIIFYLRLTNITTYLGVTGYSNAFRVYSPTGAHWQSTSAAMTGSITSIMIPNDSVILGNIDGLDVDTVEFLGNVSFSTSGIPSGFDEIAFTITIGPIDPFFHGHSLIFDTVSQTSSLGGGWLWAAGNGDVFSGYVLPRWSGRRFFTIWDTITTGVISEDGVLPEYSSLSNYPNPFNASTQVTYTLPEPSSVTLTIYDVLGRHVNTLVSTTQAAGEYSVTWNGTDDRGHAIGSGVYFYRLTVGDEVTARKMLMLK